MRCISLSIVLLLLLSICPTYGQKKAKVDTVAAFEALNEGQRLEKVGKFDSAITFYRQAAAGYQAYALSLPHKQKWASVQKKAWAIHFGARNNQGWCLYSIRQRDSAIQLLETTQQVCTQVLGDSTASMARITHTLANVYKGMGQYAKAMTYYEYSLAIRKKVYGEQHPEVAFCYNSIGATYGAQSRLTEASNYFQQALTIQRAALGENHLELTSTYTNLGIVYHLLGQYEQAIAFQLHSLEIRKQLLGNQHPLLASSYHNIGNVFNTIGNYSKALQYHEQSLVIRRKAFGELHRETAGSYMNIGNAYFNQGQYEQAMEYYQQSLSIDKQILDDKHPSLASSYNNIGALYLKKRQYDLALEYFLQSLTIKKQAFGEKHIDLAFNYSNIGVCFKRQGQEAKALEYYQLAYTIVKQAYGESHPLLAPTCSNIASVYEAWLAYDQSLDYYQQSLRIAQKAYGSRHPVIGDSYHSIGKILAVQGYYTPAIAAFQQSIVAYLPNFERSGFQSLLSNSPEVLSKTLTRLPIVLRLRNAPGDDTFALATIRFADRYIDSLRKAYTYENDKLELGTSANQLYQVAIDVAKWNKLEEEAFYYSEKNKTAVLSQSLNEATALKLGGIPDSLLEKDKELRTLVAFYSKASMDEELKCPKCDSTKLSNFKNALFSHQQQHNIHKSRLENQYPQYFALKYKETQINVREIQQGFLTENPNSAILEYLLGDTILYAFCITKDSYRFHRQKLDSTRYKKTNLLQLEINKLIRALADDRLHLDPTTIVSQPASILYEFLIKPFEQQIKGKDLLIIPDAELNKIPFELLMKSSPTLINSQKWQELPYLIKQHNISYHYSAHLLLEDWQKGKIQPTKSSGFIAFAPIFSQDVAYQEREKLLDQAYQSKRMETQPQFKAFMGSLSAYAPLPGTEREVKAIYELFNQNNQPAKYYINDQANESTVQSIDLKPYKYLHFATHGLTDEDRPTNSSLILAQNQLTSHPTPNPSPFGENPTSGPSPNGENPTPGPSPNGENPTPGPSPNGEGSTSPDNLLTSSEMYSLELDAELVVLSACQTGKGKLRAGEGIIGLTRGLLYAGARNLLVSQWNVNDASTAELMTKFYNKLLAGQSNRQALREAKLELLNSTFACPHYWSAFVLVGR